MLIIIKDFYNFTTVSKLAPNFEILFGLKNKENINCIRTFFKIISISRVTIQLLSLSNHYFR